MIETVQYICNEIKNIDISNNIKQKKQNYNKYKI